MVSPVDVNIEIKTEIKGGSLRAFQSHHTENMNQNAHVISECLNPETLFCREEPVKAGFRGQTMHLFPWHSGTVWFDEKILTLPTGYLAPVNKMHCFTRILATKHSKGDGFVADGGSAKIPKALLASVLTEEGGGTDARNKSNSSQGRKYKH